MIVMLAPDDERDHVHENQDGQEDRCCLDRRYHEGENGKADERECVAHTSLGKADKQHGRHGGVIE
jgi:hypothetical protein